MGGSRRTRLDLELVRRGLASSRSEAQDLILRGEVLVAGVVADKAARLVLHQDPIHCRQSPRFVSRGGEKLDGALDAFAIDPEGLRILDAGASTGGFTDCVLQRGAREVVAVDVGHGQLHERLRRDPRVRVHEGCNVRYLTVEEIGGDVDAVVADLSFISLRLVLAPLVSVLVTGGWMVLLVKPQFEAGRAEVDRGRGVISDPAIHERVREEMTLELERAGVEVRGWVASTITGARGNQEFLVYAVVPEAGGEPMVGDER